MKGKPYSEEQIIRILKQVGSGKPARPSEPTFVNASASLPESRNCPAKQSRIRPLVLAFSIMTENSPSATSRIDLPPS